MIEVGDIVEVQDRTGLEASTIEGQHCYVLAVIRGSLYGGYEGLLVEDATHDRFVIPVKQVKLIKRKVEVYR
ncbi:TPA_asm: hypothetical protein GIM83_01700 [Listeria monocytogenes]|nr:hypothetical protein [Listeria monocytogenes]EAF1659710.1 hypothetical protein [Listeria monocytogenes]ELX6563411.1 hypothetical protein [Listeria monocytogenes]HAA9887987.1 hypothetical protein [Listeria monocytogenes]HAC1349038.1 hypothetical protein [Listeria monocytogenes]